MCRPIRQQFRGDPRGHRRRNLCLSCYPSPKDVRAPTISDSKCSAHLHCGSTKIVQWFYVSKKQTNRPTLTGVDRKSTRLNSSHLGISYAVFCLKKKKNKQQKKLNKNTR